MSTIEADVLADLQAAEAQRRLHAVQCFELSESVISISLLEKIGALAKSDPDGEVRAAAERVLRTSRARMKVAAVDGAAARMTPEMIGSILSTASTPERQRLLTALQQRDDPAVLPPVLAAIALETDDRALAKMLALVGRHGQPEHLPVVRPFLVHDDAKVQATALEAVAHLAPAEPPAELLAQLEGLAASHAQPDLRFLARRIVGRLRPPRPEPPAAPVDTPRAADVARAIGTETDVRALAKLVMVLKDLGAREHVEVLRPLLKHEDPRVCANAVEAVAALGGEEFLPALFPLLAREDNRLRANLMLALYPRFPDQVMGYVRRMLRSDRVSFRISGLYCAQFLDTREMYPAVWELIQQEREPDCFRALLEWCVKHGPRDRVQKDLPDLEALRPDRESQIREGLAKLTAAADPVTGQSTPPPPRITKTVRTTAPGEPPVRPRVTGSVPIAPPRRTGPVRVAPPPARGPGARALGLAALVTIALMAALGWSAKRQQQEATAVASARAARPPDGRAQRATVVGVSASSATTTIVDLVMYGSPYKLHMPPLKDGKLARGSTLWIVDPKLVRDRDGSGWLTAAKISAGERPEP